MYICRNCNKKLPQDWNMYHSFCSSYCCADFAIKNDITFNRARSLFSYISLEEFENREKELNAQVDSYSSIAHDYESRIYTFKDQIKDLEEDKKTLIKQNKDLFKIIKELKSHSDRFRLMELDSDE